MAGRAWGAGRRRRWGPHGRKPEHRVGRGRGAQRSQWSHHHLEGLPLPCPFTLTPETSFFFFFFF